MSFGGSCFLFVDDIKENWTQATHHCASHRAHLAVPNTETKDLFLREQTRKLVKCNDEYAVFCVAASDIESEGVWKWSTSNTLVVHFNWSPGQPQNTSGEDCLIYTKYDDFRGWHDDLCTDNGHFICEKTGHFVDTIIGYHF